MFYFSSPLSPYRKEQLEAAARYVSDYEFPSFSHYLGMEGPARPGIGPLGSYAAHRQSSGAPYPSAIIMVIYLRTP